MGRGWEEGVNVCSSMERSRNLGRRVCSLNDKIQDRAETEELTGQKAAKQRAQGVDSSPCGVRSPPAPWKTRSGEDSEAGAKLSVTGEA